MVHLRRDHDVGGEARLIRLCAEPEHALRIGDADGADRFAVAQGLEGAVVSPRMVGDSVGLRPVWVVLALTVGGFYFGFVGLLIGVPAAVGVKLLVTRGLARYRESSVFKGGDDETARA